MIINLDLSNKSRQEILDGFVNVCKNGTSKDCSRYVNEAKRCGVSYEELCAYARKEVNK